MEFLHILRQIDRRLHDFVQAGIVLVIPSNLSPPCPRVIPCLQRKKSSHSQWPILSWRKRLTAGIRAKIPWFKDAKLVGDVHLATTLKLQSMTELPEIEAAHIVRDKKFFLVLTICKVDFQKLQMKPSGGTQVLLRNQVQRYWVGSVLKDINMRLQSQPGPLEGVAQFVQGEKFSKDLMTYKQPIQKLQYRRKDGIRQRYLEVVMK